jgi:hypothetical protein
MKFMVHTSKRNALVGGKVGKRRQAGELPVKDQAVITGNYRLDPFHSRHEQSALDVNHSCHCKHVQYHSICCRRPPCTPGRLFIPLLSTFKLLDMDVRIHIPFTWSSLCCSYTMLGVARKSPAGVLYDLLFGNLNPLVRTLHRTRSYAH